MRNYFLLATKVGLINAYIANFNIILLVETFVERKDDRRMETKLPKDYRWFWSSANRENERGRPWGGQLIGVRKELKCNNPWDDQSKCCSVIDVELNGSIYNITNVYNREGIKSIKILIVDRLEANLEKKCIVMGDWNARTGSLGGRLSQKDNFEQPTRDSTDEVINNEGLDMLVLFDDCGLSMLNGNKDRDWQGATTHVDYRSTSVIDYGAAIDNA